MPPQLTLLGRPLFIPLPPRRFRTLAFIVALFLTSSYILFPSVQDSIPEAVKEHIPDHLPHPQLPDSFQALNPFRPPAHKPPVQANSSAGNTKWHADWRWRNPFSSSVTFDEDRALLPPLASRPPVYTFYEPSSKDKAVGEAEEAIILQWRKAWWAQGFKPVVLGRPEALKNPLYKAFQMLFLEDDIEVELARWLAWGSMGDGVLADWLTFPMAPFDNSLLSFLRRGQYPILTRYEGLGNGLYCGEKSAINGAVSQALKDSSLKSSLNLADHKFSDIFHIDADHDGVSFYNQATIHKHYKTLSESVSTKADPKSKAEGLTALSDLINSHLHTTWQSHFKRISVIKPLAGYTSALIEPAFQIAQNLSICPSGSPIPNSCPPNQPSCTPCTPGITHLDIDTPNTYRNKTGTFHIGIVPHPFTTSLLTFRSDSLPTRGLRRSGFATRDPWLGATIEELFSVMGVSNSRRIGAFKSEVARDGGAGWGSLWISAEEGLPETEWSWCFGFRIPHGGVNEREAAKADAPVPGEEVREAEREAEREKEHEKNLEDVKPPKVGPVDAVELERARLGRAKKVVLGGRKEDQRVIGAAEKWDLGDAEVWKFVRAFVRRGMEVRKAWEEEERSFAGAERGRGSLGRWWDR